MASRSKKRARSTPPQPSAALARLEMLAGSVLDAYGATNSFDKDGEAELEPDELRRQKVPRSPKAKERSKHAEPSSSSDSAPAEAQSPPARVPTVKQLHLRDLPPPPISVLREAGYLETDDTVRRLWAWVKSHEPDDLVWPTPTAGVQVPRYTPAPQPPAALPHSPAPQPMPHTPCSALDACAALHPRSAPSLCTLALLPYSALSPSSSRLVPPCKPAQEPLRFDACGWPAEHSTAEAWLSMLQVRLRVTVGLGSGFGFGFGFGLGLGSGLGLGLG